MPERRGNDRPASQNDPARQQGWPPGRRPLRNTKRVRRRRRPSRRRRPRSGRQRLSRERPRRRGRAQRSVLAGRIWLPRREHPPRLRYSGSRPPPEEIDPQDITACRIDTGEEEDRVDPERRRHRQAGHRQQTSGRGRDPRLDESRPESDDGDGCEWGVDTAPGYRALATRRTGGDRRATNTERIPDCLCPQAIAGGDATAPGAAISRPPAESLARSFR